MLFVQTRFKRRPLERFCKEHHILWWSLQVSFWPCQWNLIKTLQNEAITPLITKITLKIFWTFSVEVIRPTKINIWWRHFRNKTFLKMKLSKNTFYKSWAPKLIFSNENFFRKIRIIFDIENWLWKPEFCNLAGLITLTKNVQKNFQSHFCD